MRRAPHHVYIFIYVGCVVGLDLMAFSDDREAANNSRSDILLARLDERVQSLMRTVEGTNQELREAISSIRNITQNFNSALTDQSEKFLAALKSQGERHEREMAAMRSELQEVDRTYVKRGDVSQTWQLAIAVAKILSLLAFLGVPAVTFAIWRSGILRP